MPGLLDNPYIAMGLGILGSSGPGTNAAQSIGKGGLLGLEFYQRAQEMEERRRLKEMEAKQRQLEFEAQQGLLSNIPEEMRPWVAAGQAGKVFDQLYPQQGEFNPKIQTVNEGNDTVTYMIDPESRQMVEIARGPRWNPNSGMGLEVGPDGTVRFGTGGNWQKPPTNYSWVDPANPALGVKPIAGHKEERRTAQEAAVVSNIEQVNNDVALVVDRIFPEGLDKPSDWQTTMTMGGNVPYTEGRTAKQAIRRSVEVMLRLRTGAAAPKEEVASYTDMFAPNILDSDDQKRIKLQRLQDWFSTLSEEVKANNWKPIKTKKVPSVPTTTAPPPPAALTERVD